MSAHREHLLANEKDSIYVNLKYLYCFAYLASSLNPSLPNTPHVRLNHPPPPTPTKECASKSLIYFLEIIYRMTRFKNKRCLLYNTL